MQKVRVFSGNREHLSKMIDKKVKIYKNAKIKTCKYIQKNESKKNEKTQKIVKTHRISFSK